MAARFQIKSPLRASLTAAGICLLLLFSGCLMISGDRNALYAEYATQYKLENVRLNVLESGDRAGSAVVLIHGTPGSAGFFSNYLTDPELQDLRLLAIDRPGWGSSEVLGQFDAKLSSQSEMLGDWFCQIAAEAPANQLVILAHSYGASVTPRLLIDHPECISAALLLAGGADPALTAPRWYNRITNVPPLSWLASIGGMGLKKSNDEMMQVRTGLIEMQDLWQEINVPVTVIQGEEDMLVHPDNADFIEDKLSHIPATVIRRIDDGHMIVHSDRPFVINELRELIALIQQRSARSCSNRRVIADTRAIAINNSTKNPGCDSAVVSVPEVPEETSATRGSESSGN